MKVACDNCRTHYESLSDKEGVPGCPTCGHVNTPKTARAEAPVPRPHDEGLDHSRTMMGPMDGLMADNTGSFQQVLSGRKSGLPPGLEPILTVLEGDGKGREIPISKTQIILGRKESDILINDPEASRRHCALTMYQDLALVKDMDSANGTMINERLIREALLRPGDRLQIGTTVLRFALKGR